jgi:hypothetical protein
MIQPVAPVVAVAPVNIHHFVAVIQRNGSSVYLGKVLMPYPAVY